MPLAEGSRPGKWRRNFLIFNWTGDCPIPRLLATHVTYCMKIKRERERERERERSNSSVKEAQEIALFNTREKIRALLKHRATRSPSLSLSLSLSLCLSYVKMYHKVQASAFLVQRRTCRVENKARREHEADNAR